MRNLLLALMLFASPVMAQDSVMVSVPRSALTAQQLAGVEAQGIKEKAEAYGAWVGVGKEVGEAVNSSLSAISDNAAKFADTKVGKFSMFIVAWKVLGNDILGVFYALILVFIGLPVLIWSYRRHLNLAILDKEIVEDGKVKERIYREMEYDERNSRDAALFFHGVGVCVLLACISFALFA
jgi:hypothetical protein